MLVHVLALAGWIETITHLIQLKSQWISRGSLTGYLFIFFSFLAFVITLLRFIPWNGPNNRGYGIEEHFEKTIVPSSYILVITNTLHFLWIKGWPILLVASLMLIVIQGVNIILLYFHFKDYDLTPPSYFSRNLHLKTPLLSSNLSTKKN